MAIMEDPKLIRTCSIWRALEIVGDTSTILILEASWLGARRFDQFRMRTSLRQSLLSDRLKKLVSAEVMAKVQYSAAPPRFEYRMTRRGQDLYWASLMMLRWERRWAAASGDKCDVELTHRSCGKLFDPTPTCTGCNGEISAREVSWSPGPGVGWMSAQYSRRRQHRDSPSDRPPSSTLMDEVAQIMGDRWAGLVLRALFTGIRKFDEILSDSGMSTNILSERLHWLIGKGMIRTHEYSAVPRRHEYRLTQKGIDYYPVLLMLMQWGDKYYIAPEGAPLVLRHKSDAHHLKTVVTCSHCGEQVRPQDVDFKVIEPKRVAAASSP
jgi:DNA-binding HxlR family transcriptional regulator